ncbi:hypothetical protein [Bordetella hinzii]|uniref:hypothetical protein n=1 Tax=Bordetella hinzii TaxID=103855 RepID=UPI00045AE915|nr:hypothetical protein [Bordetella hinzii]KCB34502.1 hypothetical protein L541_2976 [Bordetella hinzii CA90 BAL1384]KCB48729.1 hypothetical protein L538_2868 [Bordetella hinzii 4161]KXA73151.1 hypothetical protein AXA74_10000 [Bordetella hinzii LMG 13501]QDJ38092.1 hypothetical protein CBR67_16205 [Bordetella hinzii]VEH24874.1 tight adherance protein E [Bordetella hinzii]
MSPGLSSSHSRSRGQAAIEFIVALLALLLAASALYEAMQWHRQRQLLYLALIEAARAGSVSHLRPEAMARAFEAALAPLWHASHHRAARAAGLPPWRLEVLQPTEAHYRRHGQRLPGLPEPAINNDHQAEQARARPGPPTIHEANTLRLRLTYASAPATSLLAALLPGLAPLAGDACRHALLAGGWLALRLELSMEMHSHPVRWPETTGVHTRSRPCG